MFQYLFKHTLIDFLLPFLVCRNDTCVKLEAPMASKKLVHFCNSNKFCIFLYKISWRNWFGTLNAVMPWLSPEFELWWHCWEASDWRQYKSKYWSWSSWHGKIVVITYLQYVTFPIQCCAKFGPRSLVKGQFS